MKVHHISAFATSDMEGGNPAGVMLCDAFPTDAEMQATAHELNYSETVFAHRQGEGWRVRYFSPINEVPFCGHATIALGAVLAKKFGSGMFPLVLNSAEIAVDGQVDGAKMSATLTSAPTSSATPSDDFLAAALDLFGLCEKVLDQRILPAIAEAGARHLILALDSRERLSAMQYDLAVGKALMARENLITIMLVHAAGERQFNVRNAFASGGVFEDPATGAAAAAFGGYLREIGWPHGGQVELVQGEDMGMRSELTVTIPDTQRSPVKVGGQARVIR